MNENLCECILKKLEGYITKKTKQLKLALATRCEAPKPCPKLQIPRPTMKIGYFYDEETAGELNCKLAVWHQYAWLIDGCSQVWYAR
jgi:hypothetical protein